MFKHKPNVVFFFLFNKAAVNTYQKKEKMIIVSGVLLHYKEQLQSQIKPETVFSRGSKVSYQL